MQLVDNWKRVLLISHSMWAMYLGIICLFAPDAIYVTSGVDTDPALWTYTAAALFVYGALGRLLKQGAPIPPIIPAAMFIIAVSVIFMDAAKVDEPAPAAPVASEPAEQALTGDELFLEQAVPFVGRWEGLRLEAYLDIVGVPTICYGETDGVQMGMSMTKAECDAMFGERLLEFRSGVHGYMTAAIESGLLPIPRDVAFTSLAYNVGISGAGKSTAVRRLNGGDVAGACEALTWWNKAGGRVVRGLVARRTEERDLCLSSASFA